ncbi:hypothetical protein BGZ76_005394 [Entomortierella beljakovae]|nr:hypothetical protein BGZ76_005394 [Entomortierella beljakovae]
MAIVEDEVTVMLSDSSVCVIKDSNDLDLRDQTHDQSCFFPDSLAPGHAVHGPTRVFKNAEFIIGSYSGQKQGYVVRTDIINITVNWLSFNPLALDQTPSVASPPNILDDFENIIVYKSVEQHCTYELQDRVKITDKDTLKALGLKEYCPYLRSKSTRLKCPERFHSHAVTFATDEMRVIGTKTLVTIQWQDSSISEDIPSTSLVPYLNIDDQDVWPSDYILLKAGEVLMDQPGGVNFDKKKSDMLGIVQTVDSKERTTIVKWFSEDRDQGLEQEAEELSLYEIMSHPDLKFRMGDLVVISREREQSPTSDIAPRAPSVDDILLLVARGKEIFTELLKEKAPRSRTLTLADPRTIERRGNVLLDRYGVEGLEALDRYLSETNKTECKTALWLVERGDHLKPAPTEEELSNMTEDEKETETIRTRLNWIGQIWEIYRDRPTALIRFMDGTTEEISVGRIMVVDDEDDDDDEDEEDGDDEFDDYDFDQDDTEEVSSDGSWETDSELEEELVQTTDESEPVKPEQEQGDKEVAKVDTFNDNKAEVIQDKETVTKDPLPEPEELVESNQSSSTTRVDPAEEHDDWKSFLILEHTPADHHFLNQEHDIPNGDKTWTKRIAKEHAILSSSLPDGILVRAFEDRMDLLRVLIQGPDHTPYRNALFLFDFKLSSHFPLQPPVAYFHSWTGGIGRINPNLYEEGNVCLSLLNTWHGKDQTETWTPSSSVLQLLISLQGLVLVPEPYYNEAGFEKFIGTKEAERNSELYNEKVYLLSLRTIQTILNNPPAPFEKETHYFYFTKGKLEQTVIEGLELIDRSETTFEAEAKGSSGGDENTDETDPSNTESGSVIKKLTKGALKMLKKHIDALSLSLEE